LPPVRFDDDDLFINHNASNTPPLRVARDYEAFIGARLGIVSFGRRRRITRVDPVTRDTHDGDVDSSVPFSGQRSGRCEKED
jgi:hypothetical protein